MSTTAVIYARVSSDRQAQQATIDSQLAALREHAAADGHRVLPIDEYIDDGVSGATLARAALERLRDRVAEGEVARLYVHSPDRLARRYALQAILLEEFAQQGVAVVFLHGGEARTPEERMLVQMQGMFAEYERAHIAERTRRGRLHKARAGVVNVLCQAPYGYSYVRKTDHSPAEFRVLLPEARVVRDMFRWIADEQVSIREVARRLRAAGVATRRGDTLWRTSTILGMLKNPAYIGKAEFGRRQVAARKFRLRSPRGLPAIPRREKSASRPTPPQSRIVIPVPPIVEEGMFTAVQEQLRRNQALAARNRKGEKYLLQGLVQCARCEFAFAGVTGGRPKDGKPPYVYYRCRGKVACPHGHAPVCDVPGVRAEDLDGYVWQAVRRILEHPERLVEEWSHRSAADGTTAALRDRRTRAEKALTGTEKAHQRLLDAYEAGLIDLDELKERIDRVRLRLASLKEDLARADADLHRTIELTGVIATLRGFAEKVREGLNSATWAERQQIIRAIVQVVRIDVDSATIIYRIPSLAPPSAIEPENSDGEDTPPADGEPPIARLCSARQRGAVARLEICQRATPSPP